MTITTVWRLSGERFDVDAFLAKNPELSPSLVWRRGERRGRARRGARDSGLNIPICEKPTVEATMAVVHRWLSVWRIRLRALNRTGTKSVLDLGIYVGGRTNFAPRVEFHPQDIARLASAGVSIAVSAYPVSDND